MREGSSRKRAAADPESQVRRNAGGAGGRMASAGGSATARRTAPRLPNSAAPRLTSPAIAKLSAPGR